MGNNIDIGTQKESKTKRLLQMWGHEWKGLDLVMVFKVKEGG